MRREAQTLKVMISMFCHDRHHTRALCPECRTLLDYAQINLRKCPFQEAKTSCAKCPVHCYKPEMRAKIRSVMRYVGPRMIYRHPILAYHHMLDSRRKRPLVNLKESNQKNVS
jgi:hypothetical protein